MATGFTTITAYPSADLATNGTIDFTYASGNASQFAQANEVLVASGLNDILDQAANTFTLSYGASKVTLTYKGSTTIPAGSKLVLQLPLATYESLTDSTTGTASNTVADVGAAFSQATLNNNFASITAKINTLIALSKDRDNIPKV